MAEVLTVPAFQMKSNWILEKKNKERGDKKKINANNHWIIDNKEWNGVWVVIRKEEYIMGTAEKERQMGRTWSWSSQNKLGTQLVSLVAQDKY